VDFTAGLAAMGVFAAGLLRRRRGRRALNT
jgi:MYXO-CTERM domain-containing protein